MRAKLDGDGESATGPRRAKDGGVGGARCHDGNEPSSDVDRNSEAGVDCLRACAESCCALSSGTVCCTSRLGVWFGSAPASFAEAASGATSGFGFCFTTSSTPGSLKAASGAGARGASMGMASSFSDKSCFGWRGRPAARTYCYAAPCRSFLGKGARRHAKPDPVEGLALHHVSSACMPPSLCHLPPAALACSLSSIGLGVFQFRQLRA